MGIVNKMNEAIEERGITRVWLAKQIGVGESTLRTWLGKEKISIPPEVTLRIIRVLGLKEEDVYPAGDPFLDEKQEGVTALECIEEIEKCLKNIKKKL